jgi:hypothetical protein
MIEKWLGGFAVFMGAATIWMMAATIGIPPGALLTGVVVGAATVLAGVLTCLKRRAGLFALVVLFVLQSVEYATPESSFSMVGPITLGVGWGYAQPELHIRINLLTAAAAACAFWAVTKRPHNARR